MLIFFKNKHANDYNFFNFFNLKKIDKLFLISIVIILLLGLTFLYSASGMKIYPWPIKHIINIFISSFSFIFFTSVNLKFIKKTSLLLFYISLTLLIATLFFGSTAKGATRWITLGFIKIQPSEIMKFSYIIYISKILSDFDKKRTASKNIFYTLIITSLTMIPILLQPDLTTGIIVFSIGCIMIFVNGLRYKKILAIFSITIFCLPVIWNYMHDYQKNRVFVFLNPELDPMGKGYNVMQSKIAIGSGGFSGQGIGKGSQSQLKYLPEKHTDFIFTMICEELGFVGAILTILLYLYIIYFNIKTSLITSDPFIINLSVSIAAFFFLHLIINTSMTTGMIPAAGIPLPMISYGGTILLISSSMLGLSINNRININKKHF